MKLRKYKSLFILIVYGSLAVPLAWSAPNLIEEVDQAMPWRALFLITLAVVGWFLRDLKVTIDRRLEEGTKEFREIHEKMADHSERLTKLETIHGEKIHPRH